MSDRYLLAYLNPQHLDDSEIEYELQVRLVLGIESLDQKAKHLRKLLYSEKVEEVTMSLPSEMDLMCELEICTVKPQTLIQEINAKHEKGLSLEPPILSKIIQLMYRWCRILIPGNPQIESQKKTNIRVFYEILKSAFSKAATLVKSGKEFPQILSKTISEIT
jgi:hypothetical protein